VFDVFQIKSCRQFLAEQINWISMGASDMQISLMSGASADLVSAGEGASVRLDNL